ncbi:ATP phosphoribosyltransferase [Asaia lannensis]|uniref:ATP phosphoribosyltransferase n=1 Tax=Asaia lannensis NBRC 102526 TaxID=1307926 RepID=A0ABT1CJ24_9PROT|nr:ATP phosphoribosyltransferase [Asaia lannensis]MCO6160855.1 ATP phosphoribosyltransferase [Asaia lannensis NBRC 102526]GBR01425.1 ATP phosphoribosyltransferase [Asaia lannensis NBRC 102526]
MNAVSEPASESRSAETDAPLILALPKGRILKALGPVLERTGLFQDGSAIGEGTRSLRFPTLDPKVDVVRVRSFDVATFVAHGGAQIGVCGADVLMEFDYPDIYAPLDLGIGGCRISIARPVGSAGEDNAAASSHLRVATKYPTITRRHFAAKGVNAEIVHLHGAMELAPTLDMASVIVDLVDTGSTLKANGLRETDVIAHVTSRLIVNRVALKTRPDAIRALIERFRDALQEKTA